MDSKTRAYLRGLAMKMQPIMNIGKGGVTDNLVEQLNQSLEARELVKVRVLKNADCGAKDIIEELAKATNSQAIQAVGGMITLYRVSKNAKAKHIEIPR